MFSTHCDRSRAEEALTRLFDGFVDAGSASRTERGARGDDLGFNAGPAELEKSMCCGKSSARSSVSIETEATLPLFQSGIGRPVIGPFDERIMSIRDVPNI